MYTLRILKAQNKIPLRIEVGGFVFIEDISFIKMANCSSSGR